MLWYQLWLQMEMFLVPAENNHKKMLMPNNYKGGIQKRTSIALSVGRVLVHSPTALEGIVLEARTWTRSRNCAPLAAAEPARDFFRAQPATKSDDQAE